MGSYTKRILLKIEDSFPLVLNTEEIIAITMGPRIRLAVDCILFKRIITSTYLDLD